MKKKIIKPSPLMAVKAMKKALREAELEQLGPGFHSITKPHKSKKVYSRKLKHKNSFN